ncbi:hypothetical protein [Jatrophihabitans lederbergiae]|uniref:Uncharacterized protein n=1 Tax=Jatrophihabitans lederbergiae TaxID=3075547 RepID=A0ABU2JHK7_9ACTN|nr:hypothetical protein [Jatrophihabitans sp. DSM 44399]MDT0263989.1 hypothetical protein [Jatrophihabitans sp. DSM 44399]
MSADRAGLRSGSGCSLMWRSACSSFALALYLAAAAVLGRGAYDLRLAVAYV